jgi:hypothetical protein
MASASCVFCRGLGLRKTEKKGQEKPCGCVFRGIFRACLGRYRVCIETTGRQRQVNFGYSGGPTGWKLYGRKHEEFVADFEIISRRILDESEMLILKEYFIKGRDWKYCASKSNWNRGSFFHAVYAVQEKLGRAFRETEPYALFPIDEYFRSAEIRKVTKVAVLPLPEGTESTPASSTRRAEVIPFPSRQEQVTRRFSERIERDRSRETEDQAA